MVPKMEACLRAVEGGLTRATVTDGRVPHALLLEIFTNAGIGTMVTQDGLIRLGSRVFSRDEGIPPHEYANGEFGPATCRSRRPDEHAVTDRPVPTSDQPPSCSAPGRAAARRRCSTAYAHAVMNTFGPPEAGLRPRRGLLRLGRRRPPHLDLLSGLAVNALGHAHPTVLSAITGQIATLGHVSNFFATPAQVALAERLAGDDRRRRRPGVLHQLRHRGQRGRVQDHPDDRPDQDHLHRGRLPRPSLGALAITHNPKYREPFEPLPGEVIFVPYGDAEALAAVVDDTVAAVVLEPIQGENGVVVPPAGYLAAAREICDRARRPAVDRRGADRHGPDRRLAGPRRPGRHAPTSSPWPRGSATASRSGPASPPVGPRACSARAATAAPSAATRSPRSPGWP